MRWNSVIRPRNVTWSTFIPFNGSLPGHVSFPGDFPARLLLPREEDQGGSVKLSGASSFLSSKVQAADNTARLVVTWNIHGSPTQVPAMASATLATQRRNLVHSVPVGTNAAGVAVL